MRIEVATLKESMESMEHLTSSIHRLRLSLSKVSYFILCLLLRKMEFIPLEAQVNYAYSISVVLFDCSARRLNDNHYDTIEFDK